MKLIRNADVFNADGRFVRADVVFDDRIISVEESAGSPGKTVHASPANASGAADVPAQVNAPAAANDPIDATGCMLIPGLVDIHTHGAMGADTCDASREGLLKMSRFYAENGVTSFCATTMTIDEVSLSAAMKCAANFSNESAGPHGVRNGGENGGGSTPGPGAKCTGIYMEGPFINPIKKGAQPPQYIVPPDLSMFRRLNKAADGKILVTAIAPEMPGSLRFISDVSASGSCKISLAHSAAGYDIAISAFKSGASQVTHLFNTMEPFSHRAPGIIGAAADMANVSVEIICDGIHIHPAVIRTAFRMFGEERVCFISDSMRAAGLPDGEYDLGGQEVFVRGGSATLKDGTIAGSSINLMTAVRKAVEFGIRPEAALKAATVNPARAIGMEDRIGAIKPGYPADMVILDSRWNILKVFIDGIEIRRGQEAGIK